MNDGGSHRLTILRMAGVILVVLVGYFFTILITTWTVAANVSSRAVQIQSNTIRIEKLEARLDTFDERQRGIQSTLDTVATSVRWIENDMKKEKGPQ